MPFKPNYGERRAERRRAQQLRHEEKQRRREEKAAQRKATADVSPTEGHGEKVKYASALGRLPESGLVLFDVIYEDGTRSSNRKIDAAELDALDIDASARAIIEAQDRKIARLSGRWRGPIKSLTRSTAQ
ncbi:MAG TPA: hypothetical protein VLX09_04380 [Stellaceae bacterium]|nr:hypothetical protein [Stellaceae bacterium]